MDHQDPITYARNESRLQALQRYDILDTLQEAEFDALARLASNICDAPISLINLVDRDRVWTKSSVGIDASEFPVDETVCQYTILDDHPLEVNNLRQDDRFADKPYLQDFVFYAGAPLQVAEGHNIGTICVFDRRENDLEEWQLESLQILADEVVARLELRLREEKLKRINDQKDELLRVLSHDMRNPLTGIIGIAGLVGSGDIEVGEELNHMMQLIEQSARHLLENVNDMLDVAQIESGRLRLNPERVNLEALTQEVVELQLPNARLKGIKLEVAKDLDRKTVWLDPVRYRQMVGNLVTNAIKFTPKEGKVWVRVACPAPDKPNAVYLAVRDNGIGIPREHHATLFRKDQTFQRRGTAGEQSTGMGLPLLKNLVQAHKGEIRLESEPGKGSLFELVLPEQAPEESKA